MLYAVEDFAHLSKDNGLLMITNNKWINS
jgi:hypothetical protein